MIERKLYLALGAVILVTACGKKEELSLIHI